MLRRFLWIVLFSFSLPLLPAAGAKHLTIEDVRRMAFDKGVVTLKEIEFDHETLGDPWPRRDRAQG